MAPIFKQLDLTHIFTDDVREKAMLAPSRHVVSKGRGPGSLEPDETAGLDYEITTGDKLPEAVVRAVHESVAWCAGQVGSLRMDDDGQAFANVNTLNEGQRYELHYDGNPITLLVFLNDDFDGGVLVADGVSYPAVPGHAILFEGWRIPHEVTEVTRGTRATMPVNLYPVGWQCEGYEGRDADTNAHLYGS
jgi:hypothetical protein